MSDQSALARAAIGAARDAAEVIRRHYGSYLSVEHKADGSPVTVADVETEQVIRRRLSEAFPDHGFLGEETGGRDTDAEYVWLVDPIDGTKSYIRRYPFFSTQIALMHEGRLVLGVSSAPMFQEIAWAERGAGAWLNDEPLAVSRIDALAQSTLSTGNLRTMALSERWNGLGRLVAEVSRIRGYGDFYHYHLLAAGKIDAVVESDVNVLDVAALSVIVEEAGGSFTDLEGEPVGLGTTSVLATNGHLESLVRGYF